MEGERLEPGLVNVLVAAVGQRDCPAARALLTEGVPCEIVALQGDYDYGEAVAGMWAQGDEIVVLEHDVVPWPGAMNAISGCEHPWCVYEYPFAPNALGHAIGCLRVSEELVRSDLDLPDMWAGVPWNQLDAALYRALAAASGEREPHIHTPPLAHLKPRGELE